MNKFVEGMKRENNWKLTENLADAKKSTTNDLVDLFATIGALRTRMDWDIESLFSKAFYADNLLATKMAFYARNIRGGLGERRTARIIWNWLARLYPEVMVKNLHLVPKFGRWDDLYIFVNTPLESAMWELIRGQWKNDWYNVSAGKPVSLLGKWLKSINTSSEESHRLGKKTAKALGLSYAHYRKALSGLRSHIDVVERKMSANRWEEINYEGVPSNAMTNYRNAFSRHDADGFVAYLESVKKGEKTIKSATLYPYDIVEKILYKGEHSHVLEEQWKALPDYVGEGSNILIMADVSGSMNGRPMATSVGLSIYFAERNSGPFKNVFMTFSETPSFVQLKGKTLFEKVRNAINTSWGMNTNIEAAFRQILRVAIDNNLSQEELPKALIIISDMEFDRCTRAGRKDYYTHMSELYREHGYELPRCVFWNVDARQNTFHAEVKDGVQFASGQSTSVFKSILENAEVGAYELMLNVLNDPMYDEITI